MPPPLANMAPLPTLQNGEKCCIWQFHRIGHGTRNISMPVAANQYSCSPSSPVISESFQLGMTLPLTFLKNEPTPEPDCDETATYDDSLSTLALRTSGPIVLRSDALGIYSGRADILDASGGVLFHGWMELYDGIRNSDTDPCRQPEYILGWLVAQGAVAARQKQTLNLSLWGHTFNALGTGHIDLRLNGFLVVHP